jgi:ribonuclease D
MASRETLKVLHGADYDLRMLDRDGGLRLRHLFDTMIAARLLGRPRVGLAALLEEEFDLRLDKSKQRADWSRRPLPPELVAYAASDTRYLPELRSRLEGALEEAGRTDWAREEFARLEAIRHEAAPAAAEAWRRVKGVARLDGRARAIFREIFLWREERAEELDRPPFKVLGREALLEVARRVPRAPGELSRIAGVGRQPGRLRGLLEAVARGREAPVPERKASGPRPPRDPVAEEALARCKRERDGRAKELGLDPGLLLPNAVLDRAVARSREGEADPLALPELRDWQRALLEEGLRPLLPPARSPAS